MWCTTTTTASPAGSPVTTTARSGICDCRSKPVSARRVIVTDRPAASAGTTSGAQTFTSGTAITLGGQSVVISGAPAAGDSFSLTPATQAGTDVFANIDAAVAALRTPVTPGAGTANLTNAISTAMGKLANTLNNVITVQASVGGRENEVQALQSVTPKRKETRIPFGSLVEQGLLDVGTQLFDLTKRYSAMVRADGSLVSGPHQGSIHKVGALVQGAESCNGWTFWHHEQHGRMEPIDTMRADIRQKLDLLSA